MNCKSTYSKLLFVSLLLGLSGTIRASTTWYVNGVNGSDTNNCKSPITACKTIGHAILLSASGDSIMVAPATYTENLTISISLNVIGSGASTTAIDGGLKATVIAIPHAGVQVSLSNVTVRKGSGQSGGGIYNNGTLRVISSTISGNYASGSSTRYGGGIYNSGTLTISNTTLTGNYAGVGGAIYNYQSGKLTISNATISRNIAETGCRTGRCSSFGGGIYNNFGTMTISNSTVSGNIVRVECGTFCLSLGGGIYDELRTSTINNSTLSGNGAYASCRLPLCLHIFFAGNITGSTLQNSIVANSPSGGNCGNTISNGHNLSSDNTCKFTSTGDLKNTDPKLGPLQNNGGPTQTQALLSGSPAIDAGNPSGCTDGQGHLLTTDQRGKPRPDREDTGGCDMGAFERQFD